MEGVTVTPLHDRWRSLIVDVADWPEPGVVFKDISPLLADPQALPAVIEALADAWAGEVDVVAGVEARGFVLGAPLACRLGVGFVPMRKAGKLPREVHASAYDLEYGAATLEVHRDAFASGARVLVVDDVLATGGTACAALTLVADAGAVAVGFAVLMELTLLAGREALEGAAPEVPVHALLAV
ncbi:MAG: apt [Frankiales bacterium]|nr:apt [Frankiales bacterium]